jgi:transcriptional regulator with XRE-family HTH domain
MYDSGVARKEPWTELPRLLGDARRRAGVTTVQAADALGIRRPAVWELEHGKRNVRAEELATLADLYGVSVTWLIGRASSGARDDRAELAAQVLANMSDAELDRLMSAIRIVRERRSPMLNVPGGGQRR